MSQSSDNTTAPLTQLYGDCRDVLPTLPAESVHLCVTSPPYYGLRAYSDDPREIGREPTPDAYIANLVAVFREVRRVLRPDGVLILNLGDSFAGGGGYAPDAPSNAARREQGNHQDGAFGFRTRAQDRQPAGKPSTRTPAGLKPKDKLLIPHRVALALQADGWYVRQDMPWLKRNAMPESVTDRPSVAHEYVFILAKSERYWWDAEAVRVAQSPATLERFAPGQSPRKLKGPKFDTDAIGADQCRVDSSGSEGILPAGRNMRTTDLWFASLDAEIAATRARLAELERVRERGGLLTDDDGEPLALPVNPRPFSGAHFAVFPPTLVEPFIKAACPRQCCPACGAGWVRVVERTKAEVQRQPGASEYSRRDPRFARGGAFVGASAETLGFRPACACPAQEPVPGVALDPFAGSGTVGQVAIAHGRRAILIELNAGYSPLQDQRTDGVQVSLFDDAA